MASKLGKLGALDDVSAGSGRLRSGSGSSEAAAAVGRSRAGTSSGK